MKQTRTQIPTGVTRVVNTATGEAKLWCDMCGKWGNHGSGQCKQPNPTPNTQRQ